jgi:hypothetical protein
MKIIRPVIDGIRSAFNSVSGSLKENNQELQPFINFMKIIYNFAKDYLAPAIGETLGFAFKALGKILSGVIDQFASMVSFLTSIYNKIKGILDAIGNAPSGIKNFFSGATASSGASFSNASLTTSPAPSMPSDGMISYNPSTGLNYNPNAGTTNITVNGAIDPESTARQIVGLLNDSSARGTNGASGLVFA